MKGNEHVNGIFPKLKRRPPLFYKWNVGIRFEWGDPEETDDKYEVETHRYWLRGKGKDIRYIHLLRAMCNQDMGTKIAHVFQ
jgi:hypothetical protein